MPDKKKPATKDKNNEKNDGFKLAILVGALAIVFFIILVMVRSDESAEVIQDNLTDLSSDSMQSGSDSPYILIDEDPDYLDKDPLDDLQDLTSPLSSETIDIKLEN